MNNFGVIEVASTRTKNAPGWAYVPDTGLSLAAQAALQPTNRKRAARNQPGLSHSDVSVRLDAKVRKDLEALDRDTHKDVNIPIPPKASGSGAGRSQQKYTANVRKILQSQKTFANHLDDYQALLALAETNPVAAAALNAAQSKSAAPTARSSPAPSASGGGGGGGGGDEKKSGGGSGGGTSKRSAAAAKRAAAKDKKDKDVKEKEKEAATLKTEPDAGNDDVEMTDAPAAAPTTTTSTETTTTTPAAGAADSSTTPTAPDTAPDGKEEEASQPPPRPTSYPPDGTILPAYQHPPPIEHAGDTDPLLISHVPPFPSDDELRALMTAPPLSYLEARARWGPGGDDENGNPASRYPVRSFCEVCGYWGRVRCIKCGARVCALECLEAHREECVTRYGL